MISERIAILIDGSNTYHYLRELGFKNLTEFDYKSFGYFLGHGRIAVSWTYYVGKVRPSRDPKSEKLHREQQRFANRLGLMGWRVEFGHIMQHGNVFTEKGVDVHIAVDLLTGAYDDRYDTAVLVSSDTDLIPAVHGVKKKGKKVEYIGFAHRPSFGLVNTANITRTLHKRDLVNFLKNA